MDPVSQVLEAAKIKELNPVQEAAVGKLDSSLIVAAPTASGKTLIAEIAALKAIKEGKKVVYIVPLRALAQEKYREFKERYQPLGVRVAMSIGDLDASDPWLASYDIIIATSEKLDSLLRHGISWVEQIGLVIADEIHLLNDPGRGPTMEMVLTRLQTHQPRILGLSATISNYQELATWLRAESVRSDYRPVKLYRGVCYDNEVALIPQRRYQIEESPLEELTKSKQSLIFISTRKGTESTAEKLGKSVAKSLDEGDQEKLHALASKIRSSLEHTTPQCERLARCVAQGTAFHHAGLANKQRTLVEDGYKDGVIKIICATPTLAAGLNLPAYRVIIRDLKRFSSFRGMDFLPVLEVQQMLGRAGRPKYDTEGEGILLPKNRGEAEYSWEKYIHGESEKITSKLGVQPVLRTHVLALIAGGVTPSRASLIQFFEKTFYAYQYKDMTQMVGHLDKIIATLEKSQFITRGTDPHFSKPKTAEPQGDFVRGDQLQPEFVWEQEDFPLHATPVGKRVSELYVDPLTAEFLIRTLERLHDPTLFTFAHLIASCMEMKPSPNVRKGDLERITKAMSEEEANLVSKPPNEWDLEYDDYLKSIKLSLLLETWADERGEDYILETYNVAPGELRARLDIADWLLYTTQELALLLGKKEMLAEIRKARLRVKYGVRKELLPLLKLKGVGRVRARRLYDSGMKTPAALRKADHQSLARIVGRATATSIKDQV